jgi:hypothetical protein
VRRAALLLLVLLAAKKADKLPAGVTLLQRGAFGGGAAAPDGKTFAYWTAIDRRKLALLPVAGGKPVLFDPGEKSCKASSCLDRRCPALAFSPDGRSLAFSVDAGLHVLDVATRKARKVSGASALCDFTWSSAGELFWIEDGALHGESAGKLADLPTGANTVTLHGDLAVAGAHVGYGKMTDVWLVGLDGASRRVFDGDAVYDPRLSPDGGRACAIRLRAIDCLDLTAGTEVRLGVEVPFARWGHEYVDPFSPSGARLAYPVRGADRSSLEVYDFAAGTTRRVIADLRHEGHAWLDEERILLFEGDWQDRKVPSLAILDVASGEVRAVLPHDSEYVAPRLVPGRPDELFMGRERPNSGARDLVRVRLK